MDSKLGGPPEAFLTTALRNCALPVHSGGPTSAPTPKRDPKAAPRTQNESQKEPPKVKLGQKGPPKRTRTNIRYKISNIKWINKHYMSNIKLFTLGEINPNANIKYQM